MIFNKLLNLIYIFTYPILYFFFRKKDVYRRINFNNLKQSKIWIHASSVGEINGAKDFILSLIPTYPEQITISSMTSTGLEVAKKINPNIQVVYLPLDIQMLVRKFLKKLRPKVLIIIETEIWPNMITETAKLSIPILIVNGRISEKSMKNFKRFNFIFRDPIKKITAVSAQSQLDKERFETLEFTNVENNKNLKFSVTLPEFNEEALKIKYVKKDNFLIVFGSSRPEEEKLIFEAFKNLKQKYKFLKLVIVPRHLNRLNEIEKLLQNYEYSVFSHSSNSDIVVIDKMGLLLELYSIADLAIVGGSFYNFGGHNPLEPAFYGKPIIMGKYHSSCLDSVLALKRNNGIIISDHLQSDIEKIILDKDFRNELGKNAKKTINQNSDSLEKNLKFINRYIKNI